jgi:membrane protease YdiL (CAAX protease family)
LQFAIFTRAKQFTNCYKTYYYLRVVVSMFRHTLYIKHKMLQLIGLLLISWLLIWLFEKGNLSVLGLTPSKDRLKYFIILFIVSTAFSATAFLLRMYFAKEVYTIAHSLTTKSILLETWYQFRTVLTEELLCRGVLLYILIKKIGQVKGVIISSIIFAVLHWTNAGVWANLTQMIIVFGFTFAMGLLLAYAYARTFSLLIPFAIHYGWNFTQNYIFPDTASGNHIFTLVTPPPTVTISYMAFFIMLLLPKIAVLIVDYLIVKQHKQV